MTQFSRIPMLAVSAAPALEAQASSAAQFERTVAYASRTDGQAVLVMHRGRIIHERDIGEAVHRSR